MEKIKGDTFFHSQFIVAVHCQDGASTQVSTDKWINKAWCPHITWATLIKTSTWVFLNNRNVGFRALEAGKSKTKVLADSVTTEGLPSVSKMVPLSSHGKRAREHSFNLSYKVLFMKVHDLITPPKVPPFFCTF
jgi:hypothetical protein